MYNEKKKIVLYFGKNYTILKKKEKGEGIATPMDQMILSINNIQCFTRWKAAAMLYDINIYIYI